MVEKLEKGPRTVSLLLVESAPVLPWRWPSEESVVLLWLRRVILTLAPVSQPMDRSASAGWGAEEAPGSLTFASCSGNHAAKARRWSAGGLVAGVKPQGGSKRYTSHGPIRKALEMWNRFLSPAPE